MSTLVRCTQWTRRGRPYRNQARAGSNPPRCARHSEGVDNQQLDLPGLDATHPAATGGQRRAATNSAAPRHKRAARQVTEADRAQQPSLPGILDADPDAENAAGHLQQELATVRRVLRGLVSLLEDPDAGLSPEETRRLSALVFSGARTVAQLMAVQARQPEQGQGGLDRALERLGHELDLEL